MEERGATAFVAVGSNVAPLDNVKTALERALEVVRVTGVSTFCRTQPVGPAGQPAFVNGVWMLRTPMSPEQLKNEVLLPIEDRLGRRRGADKYAPRTIDLDLILHEHSRYSPPEVRLPHPDFGRPFVCLPILELLPTGCLPGTAVPLETAAEAALGTTRPFPSPGEPLHDLTALLRSMITHEP